MRTTLEEKMNSSSNNYTETDSESENQLMESNEKENAEKNDTGKSKNQNNNGLSVSTEDQRNEDSPLQSIPIKSHTNDEQNIAISEFIIANDCSVLPFPETNLLLKSIENKMSNSMKESEQRVLNKIDELKIHINRKFQEIEANVNRNGPIVVPNVLPNWLPMKTVEEFQAFERNEHFQEEIKNYLIWWGGNDMRTTARQYLKDTLSDEITVHFKWTKTNGTEDGEAGPQQIVLCESKLSFVMFEAMSRTHPGVTIATFNVAMQSALRASKQRNRDRTRRAKIRTNNGGQSNRIERMEMILKNNN